ncbi:MAG: glucosyl-dolichyl phosphate glucuronosyltransferase [Candidatus Argoarchaeum ethanivorans]|uniref:Glucosyl-dolichyl phosphate glucuronosyltransferase n=1 Tax=Candidatus Argoarchaeum ethanivorans TaxID=2608793 RepID=A0A8B3S1B0_9EURY|nr:MAG: glucosyl-dolichyl phosphate glucuronosyltransferase [Candidatus Argoarchaeum ethanivorans]
MLVSVITCSHRIDRYPDLVEAIKSLAAQSYADLELIVVVDGDKALYEQIVKDGIPVDKVLLNEINIGLSRSRNRGVNVASGEVIVFFDDDAVADRNWIKELVRMYDEYDAIAAGGKIVPLWIGGKMKFLPEECYWLIGATHRGFAEGITEVRNTFGSNISFRTEVLDALGGFRGEMGVRGSGALQGEETEICVRMKARFGRGVMYNPDAIVHHKIVSARTKVTFLMRRAFWQGYSKRMIAEMGYSMDVEGDFLRNLVCDGVFGRVKEILRFKIVPAVQIFFLGLFTATVFLGYMYRYVNHPGQ